MCKELSVVKKYSITSYCFLRGYETNMGDRFTVWWTTRRTRSQILENKSKTCSWNFSNQYSVYYHCKSAMTPLISYASIMTHHNFCVWTAEQSSLPMLFVAGTSNNTSAPIIMAMVHPDRPVISSHSTQDSETNCWTVKCLIRCEKSASSLKNTATNTAIPAPQTVCPSDTSWVSH
jgi:hypothetical protein